jgi:hypothetical protein
MPHDLGGTGTQQQILDLTIVRGNYDQIDIVGFGLF